MTMMRQVQNRQGRTINPLHAILFVLALLVFLFTVIYRMVKSESFNIAMATLVESLLVVSLFVLLGTLFAYLIYFLHARIRKGPLRQQSGNMFVEGSAEGASECKPGSTAIGLEPDDEARPQPHSCN